MKTPILIFIAATSIYSQAAITVTGADNFTALGNTNISTSGDDTVTFSSPGVGTGSDQGSGVTIDTSMSLDPSSTPVLYFQFDALVAGHEIDFFYGQATTQISSADARRSDQNAFSVGINDDGDVFARENGNTIIDFGSDFESLVIGTEVTFDITVNITSGLNFTYDVTVSYLDSNSNIVSETEQAISGNQNAQSNVSNYDFHAIGTSGLATGESFEFSGFIASDMPIPDPVPEPSSLIMLASGSLLLMRRRRK